MVNFNKVNKKQKGKKKKLRKGNHSFKHINYIIWQQSHLSVIIHNFTGRICAMQQNEQQLISFIKLIKQILNLFNNLNL